MIVIIDFCIGATAVLMPNIYNPRFIYSQYSVVINENATIGSIVATIIAADNDTGAAGAVHYEPLQGVNNDYFTINGDTGIITNVRALNTNSTPKVFFLTVTVRDHGNPAKYSLSAANITIAVLSPQLQNNTINSVGSTTMTISLTKEPFQDSSIIKYQIVAQEYDPTVANCKFVSWINVGK